MVLTREDLLAHLTPGRIFYIKTDDVPNDYHYYVLVNNNVGEFLPLLLVMVTSQIDSRERHLRYSHQSLDTLVYVDRSSCSFLRKRSVFNCNNVYENSFDRLLEEINDGGRIVGELGREILRSVRHGVKISKTVSRRKQNMI